MLFPPGPTIAIALLIIGGLFFFNEQQYKQTSDSNNHSELIHHISQIGGILCTMIGTTMTLYYIYNIDFWFK